MNVHRLPPRIRRPQRTARRAGTALLAFTLVLWTAPVLGHHAASHVEARHTVDDVVAAYGPAARLRLHERFDRVGASYPPRRVTLLALKDTARLELWDESDAAPTWIATYDIRALSGGSGPKLVEGDRQVPEGIYEIEALNPNSRFHLSLKLNYPNAFDLQHARREGRRRPGSNIFIHGKAISAGCLAMGDAAVEELFVMAADIGTTNLKVAIAPTDPRVRPLRATGDLDWVDDLYARLTEEFGRYPVRFAAAEPMPGPQPNAADARARPVGQEADRIARPRRRSL